MKSEKLELNAIKDNSVEREVVYWALDWFIRGQIWVSLLNSAFSSRIQCCLLAWCYSFHYREQGRSRS